MDVMCASCGCSLEACNSWVYGRALEIETTKIVPVETALFCGPWCMLVDILKGSVAFTESSWMMFVGIKSGMRCDGCKNEPKELWLSGRLRSEGGKGYHDLLVMCSEKCLKEAIAETIQKAVIDKKLEDIIGRNFRN